MKTSLARYLKGRPKVYRFGLIGLSGAGKSCLLAALGMRRESPWQDDRNTARRLSALPDVPPPSGPNGAAGRDGDPVKAFYDGAKWLDGVERALAEGGRVEPNPPGSSLLALYHFTFPVRGGAWVALIDYSGELLTLTNEALTARLRQHLEHLDGLLILAEAPGQGDEPDRVPEELHRLQGALKTLGGPLRKGSKWDLPVALLFNKWDRRGVPSSAQEAAAGVAQLLKESPAHRCVYDDLSNTLEGGAVRAFAVSAFGESERFQAEDGPAFERPKCRPALRSFGLTEPFAWVVRARDSLDWRRFGAAGAKARWPALWQVWRNCVALGWGGDLIRRYAPDQKEHEDAAAATERVRTVFFKQACAIAAIFLLLGLFGWLGFETWADHRSYARVKTVLAAELPDEAQLSESSVWLEGYANSGWHRHLVSSMLVLSGQGAREELVECQKRSLDWGARVQGNRDDAAAIEGEAAAAEASVIPDRVERAIARLNALPRFRDADTDELRQRREGLAARLAAHRQKVLEITADNKVRALVKEFDRLMRSGKLADAAQLIEGEKGEVGEKLRKDFSGGCMERLQEVRSRLRRDGHYAELTRQIEEAAQSRHVVAILGRKEQEEINKLLAGVKREWDRDLYEQFRKDRREDDANRYLKEAPLQKMKEKVEEYSKYLRDRREPQSYTLTLSEIYWAEWWNKYENDVEVKLGGEVVIDTTAKSYERERSSDVGSHTFKAKEGDRFEVIVRVTNVRGGSFFGATLKERPAGTATFSGTPAELRDKTKSLAGEKTLGATVSITVVSSLKEPALPDWSE